MTEAKIERQGGSAFQVRGDMTFETTGKLLTASKALLQDVEDMHLDLAEVESVDSAGLALLLEWIARVKEKGGEVSLKGVPDTLLAIARLCQVDSFIEALAEKKA
jgi:phospholipid transport system transporter-binding protein